MKNSFKNKSHHESSLILLTVYPELRYTLSPQHSYAKHNMHETPLYPSECHRVSLAIYDHTLYHTAQSMLTINVSNVYVG